MDRTTAKRVMNEFSVDLDLSRSGGIINASAIQRQITEMLKPFAEGMQILQRQARTGDTQRMTFAFPGAAPDQNALQAAVASLYTKFGYRGGASQAPFTVNELQRRQYTEINDRMLDARVAASVRAEVLRAGGVSNLNRATGVTTITLPTHAAARIMGMQSAGDQNYLSGGSLSAPGLSSNANINERAMAAVARAERNTVAKQHALDTYIKKNPTSVLARQTKAQNRKKERDSARSKRQAAKAGVMGVLGTLVGLFATSVGVLTKILSASLEIAKNTTKINVDSARFNISGERNLQLRGIVRGMGYDPDKDNPFNSQMANIMANFSNPATAGFAGAVKEIAPFFQGDTSKALSFITKSKDNPADMLMDFYATAANATQSGRGGVMTGLSFGSALAANSSIMNGVLGGDSTTWVRLMNDPEFQNRLASGQVSGQDVYQFMQQKWFQEQTGGLKPGPDTFAAATVASSNAQKVGAQFGALGETVFDKMLVALQGIFEILSNALRPLIARFDPGAEVARNALAEKKNLDLQASFGATFAASSSGINLGKNLTGNKKFDDPIVRAAAIRDLMDSYDLTDLNAKGAGEANKTLMSMFGIGVADVRKYAVGNSIPFELARSIVKLRGQYKAGVDGIPLLGIPNLPGHTADPFDNIQTVVSRANDLSMGLMQKSADSNSNTQSLVFPEASAKTVYSRLAGVLGGLNPAAQAAVRKLLSLSATAFPGHTLAPNQLISALRGKMSGTELSLVKSALEQNTKKDDLRDAFSSSLDMAISGIGLPDNSVPGMAGQADFQKALQKRGGYMIALDAARKRAAEMAKVDLGSVGMSGTMSDLGGGKISFDIFVKNKDTGKTIQEVKGETTATGAVLTKGAHTLDEGVNVDNVVSSFSEAK